nr:NAD(P)-binding domain-containing protein [Pectobacterium colocasium]
MSKQQIGVVGMAVMGRNLALNIESRGYSVSIFNRSSDKTDEVIAENPGKKLVPSYTVEEVCRIPGKTPPYSADGEGW